MPQIAVVVTVPAEIAVRARLRAVKATGRRAQPQAAAIEAENLILEKPVTWRLPLTAAAAAVLAAAVTQTRFSNLTGPTVTYPHET